MSVLSQIFLFVLVGRLLKGSVALSGVHVEWHGEPHLVGIALNISGLIFKLHTDRSDLQGELLGNLGDLPTKVEDRPM